MFCCQTGTSGSFPRGKPAWACGCSCNTLNAEVRNERSYVSTVPTRLPGGYGTDLPFFTVQVIRFCLSLSSHQCLLFIFILICYCYQKDEWAEPGNHQIRQRRCWNREHRKEKWFGCISAGVRRFNRKCSLRCIAETRTGVSCIVTVLNLLLCVIRDPAEKEARNLLVCKFANA
jgi:protein involved in ribonucleotide reduction